MKYGQAKAIMILTGEKLGLKPKLVKESKKVLEGKQIEPTKIIGFEQEANNINSQVNQQKNEIRPIKLLQTYS